MQVHISRNGQSFGPYTPAQVSDMLQSGMLEPNDSIWIEPGDWEPLTSFSWLFGSRAAVSPTVPSSILRVPGSERLVSPSFANSGMSSLQTNGRSIRPASTAEEEGSTNLMKDAFDL